METGQFDIGGCGSGWRCILRNDPADVGYFENVIGGIDVKVIVLVHWRTVIYRECGCSLGKSGLDEGAHECSRIDCVAPRIRNVAVHCVADEANG